jgi:hypothetical protein
VRASKLHPLTRAQKKANRGMARQRIGVEHTIARVKKYHVVGSLYRHRREDYDPVMRVVCGVVNLRTQDRLAASV